MWYTWKTACSLTREIRRTRSEGSVAQFCIVELHSHAQIVKAAIKSEASASAYNSSDQSLIEWQFAMYDVFISFFFRVVELSTINKMRIANVAMIFGPTLMSNSKVNIPLFLIFTQTTL